MTPQETAKSYDHLASHWNSEGFNRKNGIAQHERALQFVKHRGRAIDVGCGSNGRFIELLLSEGFEVEGLDVSPEMIRLSKGRFPALTFHLRDVCAWEPDTRYAFISGWDSIWHVPLDQQEAVLRKLCRVLETEGVFIFTSGGVEEPGERTNPFLEQPLYHAVLGIPKLLEIISSEGCVCRHLEYDQYPELHVYLIVQKRKFDPESKAPA